MKRIPIITGNWKMNTTSESALSLVDSMLDDLDTLEGVEIVICPPFISLAPLWDMLAESQVVLGAQNMFWEEKGAFTAEISPLMLEPLCNYVILGHSERRQLFGETDLMVERKVLAALHHNLRPIICVGENLDQYEAGRSYEVVHHQLRVVIDSLSPEQMARCVVAYEPIWAIGTGHAADGAMAQDMLATLRSLIAEFFGKDIADQVRLQYGGSVTGANISEFMAQPDIDGALVGGASLKPDEFVRICAIASQRKR